MSADSTLQELEALLVEWESDSLDDEGIARVREILRSDPEARALFVQWRMLDAALTLDIDAGLDSPIPAPGVRQTPRGMFRHKYWVATAAALMICVLSGRLVHLEFMASPEQNNAIVEAPKAPSPKESTSEGVALVTRLVDVVWGDDQAPLEVGDPLVPGLLAIDSGYAQIEFFCGATVVLEGPAELNLKSATLARVHRGRLRAQVPPAARGFAVEVADMKVIDLGTEFGLSVSATGTNVQVFDGEIELHRPQEQKRHLTAGQALVRTMEGTYKEAKATPERFLDIAALESRAKGQQDARYERWQKWSQNLRRDPRLIAYYAFDGGDSWERTLTCDVEPTNSELDGAIVGARRVPGRWASKGALEFKRPGDRVRVQIPGEYHSLTFACWVKIDSLDRWYNSLFLTDGYDEGEPHWQILDTGQMYFSIRPTRPGGKGPPDQKVLSPSFWEPALSGKWVHLATTFDAQTSTVTHYLNGKVLSREVVPASRIASTTRIGAASIGNWSAATMPDTRFAVRNLNGSMDEFTLFSAALSDNEIKEMYHNGQP